MFCIVQSQSATDQKLVLLLLLRKKLDGNHGTCPYALHVQIQSLNLASRITQLHHREAILQRQRRDKRALKLPKHEVKIQVCKAKPLPWIAEISWSFWNRQDADWNNTEKQEGDYRRVCQQWNFKSRKKKTFIQVLRCQSSCVGLVHNVEKLLHPGLRLYAPSRGKVNRRTIGDLRFGRFQWLAWKIQVEIQHLQQNGFCGR